VKIKGNGIFDKWWKIALWTVGGLFVAIGIIGQIIGPPPAKATAGNAVKACRSSSYAPRDELLGSRSSVKPDGTWAPVSDKPNSWSMLQTVNNGSDSHPYSGDPWICVASMAKDGLWTVTWTSGPYYRMVWNVKNSDLRTVAPPRDLSGPGE
jgi:hypothetical protein